MKYEIFLLESRDINCKRIEALERDDVLVEQRCECETEFSYQYNLSMDFCQVSLIIFFWIKVILK